MPTQYFKLSVNSLYLSEAVKIKAPLVDFSTLNYEVRSNGKIKKAACPPFYSDTISSEGSNYDYTLAKGVHLHFVLPNIFLHQDDHGKYLPAPNRWLIHRIRDNKKWLSESDYIGLKKSKMSKVTTMLPIEQFNGSTTLLTRKNQKIQQAFAYMGRVRELEQAKRAEIVKPLNWQKIYGQPLTSIAYGLPTFALFYPNCQSVFGFHDVEGLETDEYSVYGWYEGDNTALTVEHFTAAEEFKKEDTDFNNLIPQLQQRVDDFCKNQSFLLANQVKVSAGKKNNVAANVDYQISLGESLTGAYNRLLAEAVDKNKPAEIEQILELAEMELLTSDYSDPYAAYHFKKHAISYNYKDGGNQWELQLNDAKKNPAVTGQQMSEQSKNWYGLLAKNGTLIRELDAISADLTQLNQLQRTYDKNRVKIEALRYNIFADWYKLIYIVHNPDTSKGVLPDRSDAREYLEDKIKKELEPLQKATGEIKTVQAKVNGTFAELLTNLKANSSLVGLAKKIITQLEKVANRIAIFNTQVKKQLAAKDIAFVLSSAPLQRYFFPHEPALIFQPKQTDSDFRPMLMDWNVRMTPLTELRDPRSENYKTDLISKYFSLPQSDRTQDLQLKNQLTKTTSPATYQGTALLSSHTAKVVKEQLQESYNASQELAKNEPAGKRKQQLDANNNILNSAIQNIQTNTFGQVLSGFNQALLMRRASVQPPVFDMRICEENDRIEEKKDWLVKRVNQAVGQQNLCSPDFGWQFHPLRNGYLEVMEVKLVDSFGRFIKINAGSGAQIKPIKTLLAKSYQNTYDKQTALLPPRLLQATRLQVDFLHADAGQQSRVSNNLLVDSPVCGWVVANNLDRSLMIYNGMGKLLGQILEDNGQVKMLDRAMNKNAVNEIKNHYLKQFVQQFLENTYNTNYFQKMHQIINQSLEYIHPRSVFEHAQYALYANYPVAIVRTKISLETPETYYPNHAKRMFKTEVETKKYHTHEYEKIKFPIQIGNARLIEDGVIGYWQDKNFSTFYTTKSTVNARENAIIEVRNKENLANFPELSLAGDTEELFVLMDVRASLTFTAKIIPATRIQLAPENYRSALDRIAVSFTTAPVLTPQRKLHLPLMSDPTLKWEWWYRDEPQGEIQKIEQQLTITKTDFNKGLEELIQAPELGETKEIVYKLILEKLIAAKWLVPLSVTDKYKVELGKQQQRLPEELLPYEDLLRLLLTHHSNGILPPIQHPHLTLQEIREGYLSIANANY